MGILAAKTDIPNFEKVKAKFSKYWGLKYVMYNFKSTLLILLLGIVLIVPTVYCFSLFGPSVDNKEKVDEGQNDAPEAIIIDVVPPIAMNDTTKDFPINDDDTTKDSTTNGDVTSEDSTTDYDDTAKDPATNDTEPPSNGADTNSWPVIMIVEDNSALVNVKSEFDSRRVDSSNNWLVINKRTSIRKVEEDTRDFGKNRKVLSEDKNEELRIYRDNFHTVIRNGIDITNMLRL
ncbi:hypothetical protein AVEN_31846-1 [Araneus ventricosus]|uniref:Uncharacterized protein n=1 Tax=Araneus ventricosus TaxID=182803 RepID=A0A4Y2L7T6_ARAVE|nr:hypothetical protein AVEN_31846-1 [Araneus ventricosus]